MHITILGAGKLGGALGSGWSRSGHQITFGIQEARNDAHSLTAKNAGNAPLRSLAAACEGADVIVLATPFQAVGEVLTAAGDLAGRVLIDATLPLRPSKHGVELSTGFDDSGAEHVARLAPGALLFKTLNQTGFEMPLQPKTFRRPR